MFIQLESDCTCIRLQVHVIVQRVGTSWYNFESRWDLMASCLLASLVAVHCANSSSYQGNMSGFSLILIGNMSTKYELWLLDVLSLSLTDLTRYANAIRPFCRCLKKKVSCLDAFDRAILWPPVKHQLLSTISDILAHRNKTLQKKSTNAQPRP